MPKQSKLSWFQPLFLCTIFLISQTSFGSFQVATAQDALAKTEKVSQLAGGQEKESRKVLGAIATVSPEATRIASGILQKGGNAVDAAIGAAFALGVADGYNSGIGGGCFIVIRKKDGSIHLIDGREMAPAKAHPNLYRRTDGSIDTMASQIGPLAVGTPGATKAYCEAIEKFGKLSLSDVILPSAKLAEDGFVVRPNFHGVLKAVGKHMVKFPGTKAIFYKDDGSPAAVGERVVQKDLARTYRKIAEHGSDYFYKGEFATKVSDWMQRNGGILSKEDFASYYTVARKPVIGKYRGYEIVGFPPPSSGGVHVVQILNILENFDLKKIYQENPANAFHIQGEAMKLAFADRAHWLGDPDYANVPLGLSYKSYAKELAKKINLEKTTDVKAHGKPLGASHSFFPGTGKHTTHLSVADSEGNWVSITTTVNTHFGSKVIVPGTGVFLNNQMDDFSAAPGVPNAYGLLGTRANQVQAGKRPLSSMSPSIVLKDGKPILAIGAAGGPKIINATLCGIVNVIDYGLPVEKTIFGPRIHHQWRPDRLQVQKNVPDSVRNDLKQMGHKVVETGGIGVSQAVYRKQDGSLGASSDRNSNGKGVVVYQDN